YTNINIVSLSGGAKDNAIPREADCQIAVDSSDVDNIILAVKSVEEVIKKELECEEEFNVIVSKNDKPLKNNMITVKDSKDLIDLMYLIPNGVKTQSIAIKDLVITSNNFGVIEYDGDTVIFKNAIRSSIDSAKYNVVREIDVLSRAFRAVTKESASYPGWEYDKNSEIREIAQRVYKKMFN